MMSFVILAALCFPLGATALFAAGVTPLDLRSLLDVALEAVFNLIHDAAIVVLTIFAVRGVVNRPDANAKCDCKAGKTPEPKAQAIPLPNDAENKPRSPNGQSPDAAN